MIATTRGALLRGITTSNALGDAIESDEALPGFRDFPISIIETESQEFDQASLSWRTVKRLAARVPISLPVDDGDRIKDLRDGSIYAVDSIRRTARGLSGRASVTMKLRRTAP